MFQHFLNRIDFNLAKRFLSTIAAGQTHSLQPTHPIDTSRVRRTSTIAM
ncbi:MAG: hypothetical protein AAGK47_02525 [Bacteroidota bacterium]